MEDRREQCPGPGLDASVALTALEHSADAILVVGRDGRVAYANPAASGVFGREMRGCVFGHPLTSDEPSEVELVAPGGGMLVAEMRGGRSVWNGEPAWVVSLRDVTARRRAEDDLREVAGELARVNAELARSNRDLQDFAHAISHDLNAPLRGIAFHCDQLRQRCGDLDDASSARVERVVRLAQRMEARIASLLAFSRVGQGEEKGGEADLGEVVEECREALAPLMTDHGVELLVRDPLPRVLCQPALLAQVVENLVTNAVKYNESEAKRIEISAVADEAPVDGARRCVCIRVRDNGIGVPERQREAIFAVFRRLHDEGAYGGGTGVGLAVARRIVEGHGGRMWVEDAPPHGSVFCFTLPVAD